MASQEVTNTAGVTSSYVFEQRGGVNVLSGFLTDGTSHAQSVTNSVATDYITLAGVNRVSIQVVNGITNSCTFTLQGSNDGTNWVTIAYGQGATGAYTQAALVAAAGTSYVLYLPPDDAMRFVRANVSAANSVGTTFRVHGRS